ncbi:hypothetical protein ABFT80_27050 [Mesorhizobium sp. SB112]|uniref:hypothetical protein n=1 Tax=Mesorhizobium sp. SB112 TaxID=3151853 RepID=UPI0032674276
MTRNENNRKTGARKPEEVKEDKKNEFSLDAALNKKPAQGQGLSQPMDEANEKTRRSEGVNPNAGEAGNVPIEKTTGAGPGIAAHSKDAKVPPK